MRVFREPDRSDNAREALTFTLGAVGGLALGMLLSRRGMPAARPAGLGSDLRERARAAGERARSVARRLQPARLRRMAGEQADLTALEDAVLDEFLADGVLSERGIDVGAISPGIVELSGSVWTEEEADRAVRVASGIPGVRTVVNRLEIEDEARQLEATRRRLEDEGGNVTSLQHSEARVGGMGRRRQGHETEPDRPDDSQHFEERALDHADRTQWMEEGLAAYKPQTTERPEVQDAWRTRYDEDELSNQDPHGKHATHTLDEQPQALNADARVGEGLKPGVELALEHSDVPVKPHGKRARDVGQTSEEP